MRPLKVDKQSLRLSVPYEHKVGSTWLTPAAYFIMFLGFLGLFAFYFVTSRDLTICPPVSRSNYSRASCQPALIKSGDNVQAGGVFTYTVQLGKAIAYRGEELNCSVQSSFGLFDAVVGVAYLEANLGCAANPNVFNLTVQYNTLASSAPSALAQASLFKSVLFTYSNFIFNNMSVSNAASNLTAPFIGAIYSDTDKFTATLRNGLDRRALATSPLPSDQQIFTSLQIVDDSLRQTLLNDVTLISLALEYLCNGQHGDPTCFTSPRTPLQLASVLLASIFPLLNTLWSLVIFFVRLIDGWRSDGKQPPPLPAPLLPKSHDKEQNEAQQRSQNVVDAPEALPLIPVLNDQGGEAPN